MKTALFATLTLLAGITTSASAASSLVDVQFIGYNSYVQTGAALVGQAGDSWNTLTYGSNNDNFKNGNTTALSFADGLSSSISVAYSADNFWTPPSASASAFVGTAYANLMRTIVAGYGNGIQIDLTGLTAGQTYGFYVYTQGDGGSTGRSIGITANGVDVASATQTNIGTFKANDNYVYFTTNADAFGKIDLDAKSLVVGGEADINGFQIMAVPESSSLALMAAGLIALGALSLRRRANAR